jgi:hypothetical protein
MGMPESIVQRFLDNTIQAQRHFFRNRFIHIVNIEIHTEAGLSEPSAQVLQS